MNILKALGIMAVVGGHCGINFLSWFPVYSFHMPLFMFVSGYFFHDQSFASLLKSKAKHLLCPLLLWNLFFGVLGTVLLHYGLTRMGSPISIETFFIKPFMLKSPYAFIGPLWFVATLLEVQLLCWGLYRLCKRNLFGLVGIALLCHIAAVIMADHRWHQIYGEWMLVAERALFLFLFYVLGSLYRHYVERKDFFSVNRVAVLVILNGILLGFVSRNIGIGVYSMSIPHPIWMPLVTSLTGIYLYLQAAEILKDKVKRNSLLGFIGEHTFSILALHAFFFWLLNTCFFLLKQHGIFPLRSFRYDQYMQNTWFHITEHAPMINGIYFLVGMGGSLLCVYLYERYKPAALKWIRRLRVQ